MSLIPREEFLPLPDTHFVQNIIYVGFGAYLIEVFLRVKVVGYHDLVASIPKSYGSLCIAHGRKDTPSINTRSSISILIIFWPFVTSSGFQFSMIALFK